MKAEYFFIASGLIFIIISALGKIFFIPIGIALIIVGMGLGKRNKGENEHLNVEK